MAIQDINLINTYNMITLLISIISVVISLLALIISSKELKVMKEQIFNQEKEKQISVRPFIKIELVKEYDDSCVTKREVDVYLTKDVKVDVSYNTQISIFRVINIGSGYAKHISFKWNDSVGDTSMLNIETLTINEIRYLAIKFIYNIGEQDFYRLDGRLSYRDMNDNLLFQDVALNIKEYEGILHYIGIPITEPY